MNSEMAYFTESIRCHGLGYRSVTTQLIVPVTLAIQFQTENYQFI